MSAASVKKAGVNRAGDANMARKIEKKSLRILILDDDSFMLKLLSHTLRRLGYDTIVTADNGVDALGELDNTEGSPELVLLDLNMPEMDGIEFIRELVKLDYGGGLVLISSEERRIVQSVEKLARAHQIEVLGHLNKPVDPERLSALVGNWNPSQKTDRRKGDRKRYDADELRAALANGEVINHYQPKVSVSDGRCVGVEALVRWRHPTDGMVYPDQFIATAEDHGLIDELTRVVMANALEQAEVWQGLEIPVPIAVNVSMESLISLTFPDMVAGLVKESGVSTKLLVLEVTESRLMQDVRSVTDILTRLRLKRIGLAIDDFGTGHSSLAQLRDMPFDELKLDQSFVRGAHSNSTMRAIYTGSLSIAGQLEMKVVAEGVEDREDWKFLRRTGCDVAQGYFIARPMPAEQLSDWLHEWNERTDWKDTYEVQDEHQLK